MADPPLPGVPPGSQGGFAPVVPRTLLRISAVLRNVRRLSRKAYGIRRGIVT